MTSLDHSPPTLVVSGTGSGSKLPPDVLWSATLSAGCATLLSVWCVFQQLMNYRKPILQRFVVRILIMVPVYSISSLISLYSLDASFFIDLVRDIYEAFVIYCFFVLLVEYLGGERSLLILLHGRQPTPHPWPISKILPPMDISDPYTFLNLKRGVLQYVQIKPMLALLTVVFKATKTYNDGSLTSTSGYTYVSLAYNLSVSLCLYCLAMFWVCTSKDLQPFRPMPKFLCVKGIIFFSFWQGFGISILVALGALKTSSYDTETLSLAIQDTLICFEMPLFALLHLYAFSHKDFIEQNVNYCGRLPFIHAFRDSILGFKDVLEDSLITFTGAGFSYKTFEPAEGALHHQGLVRERRVRAGLRYSKGGKHKYWLPMAGETEEAAHGRRYAESGEAPSSSSRLGAIIERIAPSNTSRRAEAGYAPLMPDQAAEVVHHTEREDSKAAEAERQHLRDHKMSTVGRWDAGPATAADSDSDDSSELDEVVFGEPRVEEEDLYRDARRLEFGDYNNPVVDASKEEARALMRALEDGMLASHPSAPPSRNKGKSQLVVRKKSLLHDDDLPNHPPSSQPNQRRSPPKSKGSILSFTRSDRSAAEPLPELPEGCVDLLVEDKTAAERKARRERLKGEANRWTGTAPQKIFKVLHPDFAATSSVTSSSTSTHQERLSSKPASSRHLSTAEVAVVDQSADVQATAIPIPQAYDPRSDTREVLDRLTTESSHDDERKGSLRNVSLSSSMVQNPWGEF
ncbi:hypothetical protein CROQUDRAFT_657612 [Cronartium quercuum f. sp. fusiforme G11]|uniref:DUF300-domain-containing protein n=1 Tax=Cronartium quercuum f. sp. fusiforme G11 TaxID=708437 RepID=A0A9P6TBI0_9BASI|nr:hypothetical protein CROQUDRAFT_657612 [Cronartium quercuum f. sp. fusiforme G11]